MLAIIPTTIADTSTLVATTGVDEDAWSAGTTYAVDDVVSKNQRKYISLQAANLGKDPETEPLWWFDDGASNKWAMFDTSVQTGTVVTGTLPTDPVDLTVTIAAGRAGGIGIMGIVGNTLELTIRDGLGGTIIYTDTQTLQSSDGSYYSFCFDDFEQISDVHWWDLPGSIDGHVTISISGVGSVSCGLCMVGRTFDCGKATYGFSTPIENRGRDYLDALGNPVSVERGYSRTMSGTLQSDKADYNRLMAFYSSNINNYCMFIAAPGLADMVSAATIGKISRVVPAIASYGKVTTNIEISGAR